MPNTKVVFSKELANNLVNSGFKVLRTELNLKDPKFKVFVFEDSEGLQEAIDEFKKKKTSGG